MMQPRPHPTGIRTARNAFTRVDLMAVIVTLCLLYSLLLPALASGRTKSIRLRCRDNLGEIGRAFRGYARRGVSFFGGGRYPMQISTNAGGSADYLGAASTSGALQAWTHFRALSNDLASPRLLVCPADVGRVEIEAFEEMSGPTARNASVSYGIGPECDQTRPDMVLSADRSLAGGFPNFVFNDPAIRGNIGTNLGLLATLRWDTNGMHRGAGNVLKADGSVRLTSSQELRASFLRSGDAFNNYMQPGAGPNQ